MCLHFGEFGGGHCAVTGGAHDASESVNYVLPYSADALSVPGGQDQWRWCSKCHCLVYSAPGSSGDCAAGDKHDPTASNNYAVVHEDAHVPAGAQREWKYCSKCAVLNYTAWESGVGACAAGGAHDVATSANYAVSHQ